MSHNNYAYDQDISFNSATATFKNMPQKKSTKSSTRPFVKSQMEAGWKNSQSDGYSLLTH